MSWLLYYLFLKPLSLLPLPALYVLSDGLYLLLYRAAGYRKAVVRDNLERSFPEKSAAEIKSIMDEFYRYFCDLLVESVKLFSLGEAELRRRCPVENTEVWEPLLAAKRPFIIFAAHFNNWEFGAQSFQIHLPDDHPSVGIYAPLKNPFFERKMLQTRSRFGMILVSKKRIKEYTEAHVGKPFTYLMAGDQSPNPRGKSYWTTFLNQDTLIPFGTEKYAKALDMPVIYGHVKRYRRGYFGIELFEVTMNPAEEPHGAITEKNVRILEELIRREPPYWLWTHKRWKRKREPEQSAS